MEHVWVPVCEIGLGTGSASVRDCRSKRLVRVERAMLSLVERRVHVRGTAVERDGLLTLVRFGGLPSCAWVEQVIADRQPPELAA
jgi:hypothetical protein